MKLRKITSLTALTSFILVLLTSVVLYIVPHGRVAYWADWRLWGLTKTQWGDIHINTGILFVLAIGLHIFYNLKPIIAYLKNRQKEFKLFTPDFNAALILTLVVTIGTYLMIPPFSSVLNFSERIKDAATVKYGEPPFGHAELVPLLSLMEKTHIDPEKGLEKLRQANITVRDPNLPLVDIARENHRSPQAIFTIIQPEKSETAPVSGLPDIPVPGTGNKTLRALCQTYHIDMDSMVKGLTANGMTLDPDQTLKTLALENKISMPILYEKIQKAAGTQQQ